ncbi:MAG: esterase-like activity of phytase family protein [Erythrobacter sp.]
MIALGLAPGTFLRTSIDPNPQEIVITLTALSDSDAVRDGVRGDLRVSGVWEITATHPFFGGFSALVDTSNGAGEMGLLAGSDRGWSLDLPIQSGEPTQGGMQFVYFAQRRDSFLEMVDLEAMARDPETGTLWTTYEGFNAVQRDMLDGTSTRRAPAEMRRWSANSGPEAMARLDDGSFIILAEAPEGIGRTDRPGLLFAGDPINEGTPTQFRISTPPKYSPVDATALPDGSVLILLRRVRINVPADFDAAIMRADPATIEPDGVWTGDIITYLEGPLFGENFEGIAFVKDTSEGAEDGSGAIYLISDDNLSMFQRSLLVRFDWPGNIDAAQ